MHTLVKSALIATALVTAASAASATTITSLVGDQDSFGTDLAPGSAVSVFDIINSPVEAGDGDFDQWDIPQFNWTHTYDLTGYNLVGATLTIVTLDMEDAGAGDGLGGAPYDDLLFLDGIEIAGAFDDVFTPDGSASTALAPNTSVFSLTGGLLAALADGSASFFLDTEGGDRYDFISVDYALLELDVTPVPLPASLPLLMVGAGAFGLMRRQKVKT